VTVTVVGTQVELYTGAAYTDETGAAYTVETGAAYVAVSSSSSTGQTVVETETTEV
jgi:hypothetical protein